MVNEHQFMEKEKITTLLFRFSLPAVIGMFVNALYNVVDRIYIGKFTSDIALAGVTIIFPLMIFIFAFSIMIGLGNASSVSLLLGAKEKEKAEKFLGTALVYAGIVSLILMIIIFFNLKKLIFLMGASEISASYSEIYLKIITFGIPASIIGYVANASIRSDGNAKIAMFTLLIGAITNIILDTILVYFLRLGVFGAAWATIISQYVSAIWAVYYFLSKYSLLKLKFQNLSFDFSKIKRISALGSAPFAIQIGSSLVNLVYNKTFKIYGGDTALAAMGIVQSAIMFVTMPIFGINQGLQPILGYNYSAKLYKRVKEALFTAIFIATIICFINLILVQNFSQYFAIIFSKANQDSNQLLIKIATRGLKIQLLMLPIIGFQIVSAIYFQAIGKPKMSFFMSLIRQIIILIPSIIILSRFFGENGVWFAAPTSDVIATVVTFIFIKRELKHLNKLEIEQN